jgi:hypothetical protein
MSTTGAAFSVRFLRNGDQIIVLRDVINDAGDGVPLFQSVDSVSHAITPNWDATGTSGDEQAAIIAAQPIIQLRVRSASGYPAEITGVTWKYDGTALQFSSIGSSWTTATNNAKFQARIYTTSGANPVTYWQLRIIGNLADPNHIANTQISYEVSYASNQMTDTVEGSVDVIIMSSGASNHAMQVTANTVELDKTTTQATLTAHCYYGGNPVTIGQNGYTIKWFKGTTDTGLTTASITVSRSDVTGSNVFIAKLYKNGNVVAVDSVTIHDTADEYQIMQTLDETITGNAAYLSPTHNAVYNLSLLRNNVVYTGAVTYSWDVINAEGVITHTGTGAVVTLVPAYAVCGQGQGAYYGDVDVDVTATF